jgi:hypothetical protein
MSLLETLIVAVAGCMVATCISFFTFEWLIRRQRAAGTERTDP